MHRANVRQGLSRGQFRVLGSLTVTARARAPFNEIIARYLKAVDDPREVVSDTGAAGLTSTRSCRWARRASAASVSTNGSAAHGQQPDPASERGPFNEIVARYLKAVGDPREVVDDPEARYYGGRVEERSLVPLGEARLGRIGLEEWLRHSKAGA